ncbi:MAG TPA: hypothetical protein VN111_01790, partial [Ralstonia sp.]
TLNIADDSDGDQDMQDRLISTDSIAQFRAVRAPVRVEGAEAFVSSATAALLRVDAGAVVQVSA